MKRRLGQKRSSPRAKRKFPKIASQILGELQVSSEGVAFEPPCWRLDQKRSSPRAKQEFPKIASQILGELQVSSEGVAFEPPC